MQGHAGTPEAKARWGMSFGDVKLGHGARARSVRRHQTPAPVK
jgi:hypothetical protein